MRVESPPLAHHRSRLDYVPKYGDYVVWSGWLSTWHGLVVDYNKKTDEVSIIFAGLPFLLVTMDESDQQRETRNIKLSELRQAPNGKYAIQTVEEQTAIWYI